mmetsp:Transcript_42398/g.76114  ORF Transcript_42398/g.76114 Transcript_42398/m.76114 type:complete len:205 (-) Transcript_42398:530-1144(-)
MLLLQARVALLLDGIPLALMATVDTFPMVVPWEMMAGICLRPCQRFGRRDPSKRSGFGSLPTTEGAMRIACAQLQRTSLKNAFSAIICSLPATAAGFDMKVAMVPRLPYQLFESLKVLLPPVPCGVETQSQLAQPSMAVASTSLAARKPSLRLRWRVRALKAWLKMASTALVREGATANCPDKAAVMMSWISGASAFTSKSSIW